MSALAISKEELAWNPVEGMARYAKARQAVQKSLTAKERRLIEERALQQKVQREAEEKARREAEYIKEMEAIIAQEAVIRRQQEENTIARVCVEANAVMIEEDIAHRQELPPPPKLRMETIGRYICDKFDCKWRDIVSPRREASIVEPRQIIAYLCREHTTKSFPEIGKFLGHRDHTTILHAYRKIKKAVESGEITVPHVEDLLVFEAIRRREATHDLLPLHTPA